MSRRRSVWKGAAAGAIGGLAASWVMSEFQAAWSAIGRRIQEDGNSGQLQSEQGTESEDATMKTAGAIGEQVLHRPLTRDEKKESSPFVHYAFGASIGGAYGAAAEKLPQVTTGFGLPFGTAVFVGADEVAVPALGLASQPPSTTKVQDHIYSLASHLVYGATTELVRRGVRAYWR